MEMFGESILIGGIQILFMFGARVMEVGNKSCLYTQFDKKQLHFNPPLHYLHTTLTNSLLSGDMISKNIKKRNKMSVNFEKKKKYIVWQKKNIECKDQNISQQLPV